MTVPKILITGSQGRIGRVLTANLSQDFDMYGLDIREGSDARHFQADISKYEELETCVKDIGSLDCIVHLAGDARVNAPWESVLKNNIIGTRNIYECARRYSVKKVIFASSSHVTGAYTNFHNPLRKVVGEALIAAHHPVRPDSDYGSSKAFGESVARQYFELYGIQSICLRIGWVIKDDDPGIDKVALNIWLSHRDLVHLIERSILSDRAFGIYYGVSDNRGKFWDISDARRELGYKPKDDAYSVVCKPGSLAALVQRLRRHMPKFLR